MPPYQRCPSCGEEIPDWHREWYQRQDQARIFQGTAAMECPLCGALAMHAGWATPLVCPAPEGLIEKVKRDVIQAAIWASGNTGKTLAEYLTTQEGSPYVNMWTADEVRQADQYAAANL